MHGAGAWHTTDPYLSLSNQFNKISEVVPDPPPSFSLLKPVFCSCYVEHFYTHF